MYEYKRKKYMKEYYKINNSDIVYELVSKDNDTAKLKANNITVTTSVGNIYKVSEPTTHAKGTSNYTVEISEDIPPCEIMLRHMTREEALEELDRFMDKAITHHLPQVRIIHGRHGNILRNAVREYLDTHPYVVSYEYADLAHGSVGATVATLGKKNI